MENTKPTIRVECAWCKAVLAEGDPGAEVSHGICSPCKERLLASHHATQRGSEAVLV